MPLIRLQPPIAAISGTLGGATYVNYNRRPIIRKLQRKINRQTSAQFTARANFKLVLQAWHDLDAASRAAWHTLAQTLRSVDRLGEARPMTGRQLFLRHNLELATCGLSLDTTSTPAVFDASDWTGVSIITNSLTDVELQPLCPPAGPFPQFAAYIQTLYPFREIKTTTPTGSTLSPLPNRWKFLKYIPCANDDPVQIYPEIAATIGTLTTGQQLLIASRYVDNAVIVRRGFISYDLA